MLVLSRKAKQSICIGNNITVNVVRIKGNVIQLGIDAPRDVHIVRSELLERDAANTAGKDGEPFALDDATTAKPLGKFAARRQKTSKNSERADTVPNNGDSCGSEQILASVRLAGDFPSCHNLQIVT